MARDISSARRRPYKGLYIGSSAGAHEAALALVQRNGATTTSVLDVGAGSGAFLLRLRDNGFTGLRALEAPDEPFVLDDVPHGFHDLDTAFALEVGEQFGLVTAIEVIEHRYSPFDFLRQLHGLVNDGGMLLVTTPNVAHWVSRIKFLLRGEFRFFGQDLYRRIGHVSPVTDTQMRLMLEKLGFTVVESCAAGQLYSPLKRALTAPLSLPFALVSGPPVRGDVMLYLARKNA